DEEDLEPTFLEWSPRFGYDAIYCLLALIETPITEFFLNDFKADFKDGFVASQRITIPPFPYHDSKLLNVFAKDILVGGNAKNMWWEDVYMGDRMRCAGSDGILGVVTAHGDTIIDAHKAMYEEI